MIKYYCDNQQCGVEITGENLPNMNEFATTVVSEYALEKNLNSLQKNILKSFLLQSLEDKTYCDTCLTIKRKIK